MNTILEKLQIDSEITKINNNFRKYLEDVFTSVFLKKIDRVFKEPLIVESFKQNGNIMAYTVGKTIYVNTKMFNELPTDRAMVYIIHELFHVLQNLSQFSEIRTINRILGKKTISLVKKEDINKFLTGKKQNIHSDYKDEFLSYCSNAAFDWSLAPKLKQIYKDILTRSGIFNMSSVWWKRRFK